MNPTTPLGFPILPVLAEVWPSSTGFNELCLSHAAGSGSFEHEQYGEQTYFYFFSPYQLQIDFQTACLVCFCEDPCVCDCDTKADADFDSWQDYQDATNETIVLAEKQIRELRTINLFSNLM